MRDWSEVKKICNKATPGPWEWVDYPWRGGSSGIANLEGDTVLYPNHCNDGDEGDAWFEDYPNEADGNLLIIARTALPEAIAEIEQLRQEKAELVKMTVRILSDLEVMMLYCPERDKYHIQHDRNAEYIKALAKFEGGEPNAKP